MNRIANAISGLESRIATVDAAARRRLETAATMTFEEYCTFQNIKSEMTGSVLTLEESLTIYQILGSGPAAFKRHTLAERIIVIKTMQDLLAARTISRCKAGGRLSQHMSYETYGYQPCGELA